jgi:hypothetical protein
VFQAAGTNAASIQSTVDAFRTALGDPNNGNNPGPAEAEINASCERNRTVSIKTIARSVITSRSRVGKRMTEIKHAYGVRPRKDRRGVNLISDALPFGRLWCGEPNATSNAIRSRQSILEN